MSRVVSLVGYGPPPRYDAVPWSTVKFEEAPARTGPWTLIDTQALTPVDADPSEPRTRNLTTSQATLEAGWYRITFLDAFGGNSEASEPVADPLSEALPPSPDAIRNMSPLLRKRFPLPPVDDYAMSDLRTLVREAIARVQGITWRTLDPALGCAAPQPDYQCEGVPPALLPIAFEAVQLMAERIKVTTDPELAEQLATGRMLAGFTAGPYSEHYFAPGEFMRRGVVSRPAMDLDTRLDGALWELATEDAKDYYVWRASGVAPPAGQASAFDYRREHGGYSAGSAGSPLGARGGPDGF